MYQNTLNFRFSILIPNVKKNGIMIYFLILGNQQPVMIQQPMTMAPPGYTMEPNGYTSEKYWHECLDWKEQYISTYARFNIYYLGVFFRVLIQSKKNCLNQGILAAWVLWLEAENCLAKSSSIQ